MSMSSPTTAPRSDDGKLSVCILYSFFQLIFCLEFPTAPVVGGVIGGVVIILLIVIIIIIIIILVWYQKKKKSGKGKSIFFRI